MVDLSAFPLTAGKKSFSVLEKCLYDVINIS